MQTLRAFRLAFASILIFATLAFPINFYSHAGNIPAASVQQQQQLVESIDFQNNRRFSDDNLLYYIQTRPGDPFNQAQIERDLQSLLSLKAFDATRTRVLTEEGVRGGVNIIFEVSELPIIRELKFEGLKAVPESDVLKAFRENKVGISKEAVYDPVKVTRAKRILRELLSAKGFPNAKVEATDEEVSATSTSVTFNVDQGARSRLVKIDFEGNNVFKNSELRSQLKVTKQTGLFARFTGVDILDRNKLEYDLRKNLLPYVQSKGYLNARFGEPVIESLGRRRTGFFLPLPFLSSKDDTLKVTIPLNEGKLYRVGDVKISGNSIFSEQAVQAIIGLKKGEVVNGKQLRESLYESGLKRIYGAQGFIQYDADYNPDLKDNPANPNEGIADINIVINEGKQFTLRRLEFTGNTFTRDNVIRREFLLNEGDIFNQQLFELSAQRLNQGGYFDPVDKDKDTEIRADEESGLVDAFVKLKERGRQQISFNGGVSGIGGSFFGLEYSTNNLFGRGEVLSFQAGAGNRQSSFQFSFTEPYFRDRPISLGFSLFASTRKFFGEGTFLSNNIDAQTGAISQIGSLTTNSDNLFTQNTYGASVFASAPLSEFYRKRRFTQFSRVGLSYQATATSIKDPPVNASDPTNAIPVVFEQSNIITSRITPTFVYDSRNYSGQGIDAVSGTQITASLGFAGLGGDVRTYSPQLQYIHFLPVRRKKSRNPEVFGFRILAATVGSFATTDKIRNNNSLSFVGGVPIYERFFLGDEYTIRGYNTRSVGPIAPVEGFLTSQNVVIARNSTGTPVVLGGSEISPTDRAALAALGTFTGASGSNVARISQSVQFVGGDSQLLGNFEYRVPIFGPASIAAFADIGTAFNLRNPGTQFINSKFLPDQPFLGSNELTRLFLSSSTAGRQIQPFFGLDGSFGLALEDGKLITRERYASAISGVGVNPFTGFPNDCLNCQRVFLRGEAQTNTLVKLGDSALSKFGNYRSSIGLELRVQIPIVNAPFRLIYAYNPNARDRVNVGGLNVPLQEKKSVFRFSVGRTF
ncbi:MAG: outer membrane protein assembly factor BamA [Pyrinomonadaceae bacterium]